jgi:hypothetical protein
LCVAIREEGEEKAENRKKEGEGERAEVTIRPF